MKNCLVRCLLSRLPKECPQRDDERYVEVKRLYTATMKCIGMSVSKAKSICGSMSSFRQWSKEHKNRFPEVISYLEYGPMVDGQPISDDSDDDDEPCTIEYVFEDNVPESKTIVQSKKRLNMADVDSDSDYEEHAHFTKRTKLPSPVLSSNNTNSNIDEPTLVDETSQSLDVSDVSVHADGKPNKGCKLYLQ